MKNLLLFCGILFITVRSFAQCTYTKSLPYLSNFSTIQSNDQLPACWGASDLGGTCKTIKGNPGFGVFSYSPSAVSFFYSAGFNLYSHFTYSVRIAYEGSPIMPVSSNDLSINLGTGHNPNGIIPLVSTQTFTNLSLSQLSATFTPQNSGLYYFIIKSIAPQTIAGPFKDVRWTNIVLSVPCQIAGNSHSVTLTASSKTVCAAQTITLQATASHSYLPATFYTVALTSSQPFVIQGTNTLTGCSGKDSVYIKVNPNPTFSIAATSTAICPGDPVKLTGSNTGLRYEWQDGSQTHTLTDNPTESTQYIVTGKNEFGCTKTHDLYVYVEICTDIEHLNKNKYLVSVYPNPSPGQVYIKTSIDGATEISYDVMDIRGAVILSKEKININPEPVSLGSFKAGMYFIIVHTSDGSTMHKLLVN